MSKGMVFHALAFVSESHLNNIFTYKLIAEILLPNTRRGYAMTKHIDTDQIRIILPKIASKARYLTRCSRE